MDYIARWPVEETKGRNNAASAVLRGVIPTRITRIITAVIFFIFIFAFCSTVKGTGDACQEKTEMPAIMHITHASKCLQKVATGRKENLQTLWVGGKTETKWISAAQVEKVRLAV